MSDKNESEKVCDIIENLYQQGLEYVGESAEEFADALIKYADELSKRNVEPKMMLAAVMTTCAGASQNRRFADFMKAKQRSPMTDEPNIGTLEDERCNRDGCDGVMELKPSVGCTCHINPPCGACEHAPVYCPKCGEEADDDE